MSTVKERILGAVTIMSEEDAEKVWDLIRGAFALSNAEKAVPDAEEISAFNAYKAGAEEYQPSCSHEELLKELGL